MIPGSKTAHYVHRSTAAPQSPIIPGMLNATLRDRLAAAFSLTHDLFAHLDEASLLLDLPKLPSNRIAAQAWCIAGARESYLRAIREGGWQGFNCSLTNPRSRESVLGNLRQSASEFEALDFDDLDSPAIETAFLLLEHEVQHHGQLIRYVYANGLTFPGSWNERYTV
jgi:hypothetical protein